MTTNNTAVDWVLCLAWSLADAILTALVGRTAVNASVTYDSIHVLRSKSMLAMHRYVGRCKTCRKAHRVDGSLAIGRHKHDGGWIVVSGTSCYMTSCNGTDQSVLTVSCCDGRVKLQRVYDSHKPNRPRHECNAKCLASTGPACECKCKGSNHGAGH